MKTKFDALLNDASGNFAYYIEDLTTGETLSRQADLRFHAASMIKLFYLYEALRQVDAGKCTLDDRHRLKEDDKVGGAGALKLLRSGVELSLSDLLNLMIQVSDNTATNMLFDILGKDNINASLRNLAIQNTLIARKLMLPEANLYSYSTARDIATVLKEFYRPTRLSAAGAALAMSILYEQQFNDCLNGHLNLCGRCHALIESANICPQCSCDSDVVDPYNLPFAHKTGSIQGVVHDGGILNHAGRPIVAVLLSDQLPDNRVGQVVQRNFGRLIYRHFYE